MSFEERMALYKRKYNSDAPGPERSKAASGKAPDKGHDNRKNAGKAKDAAPYQAAPYQAAPEKAAPKKAAPEKAAQQPQEQATPATATQEKKGVLSRLVGIFRKK